MVDYRINLAKGLTSSAEERTRFYNGMLIYLVFCAAALVYVAYAASVNLVDYVGNKREYRRLLASISAETGVDKAAFKNIDRAYAELKSYSGQIETLKQVLGQRVQLLPVAYNLFSDLPDDVALQGLVANKAKMDFGLTMPPASGELGDPVRKLKSAWEANEELMKRVATIRPLAGERRTMGEESIFYVKFECVLNK